MEKSLIKFSEDGTSFVVNFANGKETADINSKEEGFKAISQFANDKKITPEEFAEMRDQILNAEKLPWSESNGISVSIGIMGGRNFLGEILTRAAQNLHKNVLHRSPGFQKRSYVLPGRVEEKKIYYRRRIPKGKN